MKRAGFLIAAALALGGCSLAGDLTPPPGLATAQAQGFGLPPTTAPLIVPDRPPDPIAGALLYADRCAACHGETGLGDGPQAAALPNPPAALADPQVAQKAIPREWYVVVTEGRLDRFMPGFTSLDDDQRWDVVGYALSLGLSPQAVAEGREVYRAACAACHGELGRGDGTLPDLTSTAFQAERSLLAMYGAITGGVGERMPGFEDSLSDDERWAAAAYVRSLGLPAVETAAGPTATVPVPEAEETAGVETQPAATAHAATGVVTGRVRNGTAGAAPPRDLDVVLHGFDSGDEVLTLTAPVDPDGAFRFEGLERVPGRSYVVTGEYQGVLYASEIGELPAESAAVDLPLTVFEATAETDTIHVSRLHLLFDFPAEGTLQVIELWLLSNLGDRTVLAEGGAIEVDLPAGAGALSLDGGAIGDRFELSEAGFRDRREVVPGENTGELVFSYLLPYDGRLDLVRRSRYPVAATVALIPEGGPRLSADGIVDMGVREVSGAVLHSYELGSIGAGGEIRLSLRGRVGAGGAGASEAAPIVLGASIFALALVVAAWIWLRPSTRLGRRAAPMTAEIDRTLWAIASLDNEFAAGKIDEATYRSRRADLLRRARQGEAR